MSERMLADGSEQWPLKKRCCVSSRVSLEMGLVCFPIERHPAVLLINPFFFSGAAV